MFDQLLSALSGSASIPGVTGKSGKVALTDPDVILARLALTAKIYDEPCPFRPGQLVTPRPDGKTIGAGSPHVVIEVFDGETPLPGRDEARSWSAPIVLREPTADVRGTASVQFGQVLDMRVATYTEGGASVGAYVVESQDFEAWTPEHEAAWRDRLAKVAAGPKPLSLAEVIAELRDRAAGKEVKADWKEGDLVELVNVRDGLMPAVETEGVRVGVVTRVDQSDGTTNVLYHAAETGKVGGAWFKNRDLRKYGPRPTEPDAAAIAALQTTRSPADATA